MDTHTAMQTFARVVELGSFAAAADKMGQARSVVTRQIAYLEEKYGVRLLNRTTRKLSMTDAGRAFYERVRPILAEVADLELSLQAEGQAPSGRLRVSAPVSFGILHLGPAIAEYLLRYPDVIIDLDLNDRVVDLVEDGYDVAVRIGPLQDSSLVARPLAPQQLLVCAAPAYLARHGVPQTPDDLKQHRCLHYAYASTGNEWHFEKDGVTHLVRQRRPARQQWRCPAHRRAGRAWRDPAAGIPGGRGRARRTPDRPVAGLRPHADFHVRRLSAPALPLAQGAFLRRTPGRTLRQPRADGARAARQPSPQPLES